MLHTITTISDDLASLIKDDPVRPEIPLSDRVNSNSRIYMLKDGDQTLAVTCVKFLETIPSAVDDLVVIIGGATTAVFYTIWSYAPGAGRSLILDAVRYIREHNPNIRRFVTLSPKTEMARRFHSKNGAVMYRENYETVNYEYIE